MAKVIDPKDELRYYHSIKGNVTYMEYPSGLGVVKRYRRTEKRTEGVSELFGKIIYLVGAEWDALSDEERAYWTTEAEKIYMTGRDLFIQESWKSALNAIAGVGLSGFCYSGGAVEE